MRSDIEHPEVTDIALAVVKDTNELGEDEWAVYLLNLKDVEIKNVLINSKGYGLHNGEQVKTSVLRHFFDSIEAQSAQKIEKIMEDVFGLNNEYWISFYIDNLIYDKCYVFLTETIREDYFTTIPILNKQGVMIR